MKPLDLGPGFRFAPGGEYERIEFWQTPGGMVPVVLDAFFGGRENNKPRRVELGETVVAVQWEGFSEWWLLAPGSAPISYTDAAWAVYHREIRTLLAERSRQTRAKMRSELDALWQQRREEASQWQATSKPVDVPPLPSGFAGQNPVDHFIAAKFTTVREQNQKTTPQAVDFFRDIKPLLEARCLDCHRGSNAKGELRLETAKDALAGGDSGPALVPKNAAKSELLRRIRNDDLDEVMPPKGERLSPAQQALIERWVNEGASWPELPLQCVSATG